MARLSTAFPVLPDIPRPLKGGAGNFGKEMDLNGPVSGSFGNFREVIHSPEKSISGKFVTQEWLIEIPGRPAFVTCCIQGASADQILAQWPSAHVTPLQRRSTKP